MSLADPITTFTLNGVVINLNKIRDDGLLSEYNSVDGLVNLVVSHQRLKSGRIRTLQKLTVFRDVVNASGVTVRESITHSKTMDRPGFGWNPTLIKQEIDALNGLQTTAHVTKLFGLEH